MYLSIYPVFGFIADILADQYCPAKARDLAIIG
jgi:hypothetical protein